MLKDELKKIVALGGCVGNNDRSFVGVFGI